MHSSFGEISDSIPYPEWNKITKQIDSTGYFSSNDINSWAWEYIYCIKEEEIEPNLPFLIDLLRKLFRDSTLIQDFITSVHGHTDFFRNIFIAGIPFRFSIRFIEGKVYFTLPVNKLNEEMVLNPIFESNYGIPETLFYLSIYNDELFEEIFNRFSEQLSYKDFVKERIRMRLIFRFQNLVENYLLEEASANPEGVLRNILGVSKSSRLKKLNEKLEALGKKTFHSIEEMEKEVFKLWQKYEDLLQPLLSYEQHGGINLNQTLTIQYPDTPGLQLNLESSLAARTKYDPETGRLVGETVNTGKSMVKIKLMAVPPFKTDPQSSWQYLNARESLLKEIEKIINEPKRINTSEG